MQEVRLGIIGFGTMGQGHACNVRDGKVARCRITALCDLVPEKMEVWNAKPYTLRTARQSGEEEQVVEGKPINAKHYTDYHELLASGEVDAVLIATPHYAHTTIGIDALKAGLHVMVEKPISVDKYDAQNLIAAHKNEKQVFAAMFNQRTNPMYQKLRQMMQDKELGEFVRVNWIVTNWFRTEAYYKSGGWRATWEGEGGGVLLNQCPHQLDLLQWICGMPSALTASCGFGRKHNIEVEDEVTVTLEYPNGATGVFVTSTGEWPGANRLEVVGDKGKVIIENGKFDVWMNEVGAAEFSRTTDQGFGAPPCHHETLDIPSSGGEHAETLTRFVDAIIDGTPLLARAEEGINSVELANAMIWSGLKKRRVKLPLKAAVYHEVLAQLKDGRLKGKES